MERVDCIVNLLKILSIKTEKKEGVLRSYLKKINKNVSVKY